MIRHFILACGCAAALGAVSLPAASAPFYPAQAAVFFSPNGGAEHEIVSQIDQAQKHVFVQAYLFTTPAITKALIRAHQRGVDVKVLLDKKMIDYPKSAAKKLIKAGVPTFFDTNHTTAHNKVIIIDHDIVLTGSYNFIPRAESKNAENLLVLKSPELNRLYTDNWNEHFAHRKNLTEAKAFMANRKK